MRFRNFGTTLGLLLAMALAVSPAWGADPNGQPARPGTVNYVEGQVSIHGVKVDQKSVGSVAVEQNQEIMTNRGRAEVLLTPGIFLRLDDNSAVQMISPNLTDMEVGLERGPRSKSRTFARKTTCRCMRMARTPGWKSEDSTSSTRTGTT